MRNSDKAVGFAVLTFLFVTTFGFGVLVGLVIQPKPVENTSFSLDNVDQNLIKSLLSNVQDYFLGEQPSKAEFTYGIAKGIVQSLNSEYSAFLTPDEAKEYLNAAGSAYEGIGVALDFDGTYTVISAVFAGQPAEKAGIKVGDKILTIDDEDVAEKQPEQVVGKIKGPAETQVKLGLFRAEEGEVTVTVTRGEVDLPNISYRDLGDGLYQITFAKFTEGATDNMSGVEAFKRLWDDISSEVNALSPKGLVLDLRGNPGGYVEGVRYVLEDFLPSGSVLMQEKTKGGNVEQFTDSRTGIFENIPLVVLVNNGSASSAEIFAGAIQDLDRGPVLGLSTVGKGVEQVLLDLPQGAKLLLVYKYWLTSAGRQLDKDHPIAPDEKIEDSADQLERAEELLSATR